MYIFGQDHMTKIIMCTSHREKMAESYVLLIIEPDVYEYIENRSFSLATILKSVRSTGQCFSF